MTRSSIHPAPQRADAGFTLLEALVALGLIAMVVTSYLGIRTAAVADGIEARNWRLAREIAEERMSELLAGAHEVPPESRTQVPLEDYPGFYYVVYIGESAIAEMETNIANMESGSAAAERNEWQRSRENFRRAEARGMTAIEYEDAKAEEEYQREMESRTPSEGEYEEVAVAVFFPKVLGEFDDQKETFVIRARVSTLAISGMTPDQADMLAESRGQSPAGGASSPLEGGR